MQFQDLEVTLSSCSTNEATGSIGTFCNTEVVSFVCLECGYVFLAFSIDVIFFSNIVIVVVVVLLFVLIFPVMLAWSFCIWVVVVVFRCQRSKKQRSRMFQKCCHLLLPSYPLFQWYCLILLFLQHSKQFVVQDQIRQ